jgi:hypothetical protein
MSEIAAANADAPIFVAMAEMPKVVFSCTLTTPLTWANTRLVGSDTIEAVREMKRSGIQLLEYVPRILTAPPGGAT